MGSATAGTGSDVPSAELSVLTARPAYLKNPSSPRLMHTEEISAARRRPGRFSHLSSSRPCA